MGNVRFGLFNCTAGVLVAFLFLSCHVDQNKPTQNTLFRLQSSAATGIDFNNTVIDNEVMNIFNYHNFYNGGGVATGDINNDGRPDVFFTSNQGENKLYLNKGNWKFEDVTGKANLKSRHQWHTGVCMADVNGDGWLDIYVCNAGIMPGDDRANELYINQKNGTFTEEAKKYGLDDKGASTQAVFFDYDHDGDLDCFVLNNSPKSVQSFGYTSDVRNTRDPIDGDRLYRNDGQSFKDISSEAGIFGSEVAFGLGITVGDINNDGWEDIYICNDFFEKDYLYINQKNGTFKETIDDAMGHISNGSMGADMSDINNDGYLDIFTTEMLPESDYRLKTTVKFDDYDVQTARNKFDFHQQFTCNSLQLNNHNGRFSEIAQLAGVEATGWSWGALAFDFDNDGWKDIYVCNGLSKDLTDQDFLEFVSSGEARKQINNGAGVLSSLLQKMPSVPLPDYAFVNQKNLRFKNEAQQLGLATPSFSNGAAYADLDGDGDLELIVNNVNLEAFVYRNMTSETLHHHYLKVKLQGNAPNTFGYGASVTIYAGSHRQLLAQMPSRGFQSSVEPVLTFGLGSVTEIDSLVIKWTNNKEQVLENIKADTVLILQQGNGKPIAEQSFSLQPWFENMAASTITGSIEHHENEYVDFDAERLLPKMLSTEGPKLAVADVNGDHLDDFFLGSAYMDTAKVFIQQPNGHFIQKQQPAFIRDRYFENTGAAFLDADGDGDNDLVIAAGGNQFEANSPFLQPRLYLNDGKGNFTRSIDGLPGLTVNASCVTINDFNNDGRPDIFIGGRNVRGRYGEAPESYLLQNNGNGNFTDVTQTVAPRLSKIGMVTAAQWVDINADGSKELVVVGDWMPVTIFTFSKGRLQQTTQVPHSSGWWNCLTVADINGDGKPDLLAGNFGLNSSIKADAKHPARLYVNDFDKNGQVECIPVYYKTDGKAYPYVLKGELQAQIPQLKKKFLQFKDYAGQPVGGIFTKEQLQDALILLVEQTQTCAFINDGAGNFTMQPLPVMAQLSPVFAIKVTDLNNDGINDIFLAGNFYGVKPQSGRFDASYGTTFITTARHQLQYVEPSQSGLNIKGEVRDIATIKAAGGNTYIAVAVNNDKLCLFKKKGRK